MMASYPPCAVNAVSRACFTRYGAKRDAGYGIYCYPLRDTLLKEDNATCEGSMFYSKNNEISLLFPKTKNQLLSQLFQTVPEGPLNGVCVVEIGQHVSGPMVGQRLTRKGALVIKIEREESGGDPARKYLSHEIFSSLNANKLSVAIKNNNESVYVDLLTIADVIVDNRSPEAKDNDSMLNHFLTSNQKTHPVIFCSIVGYEGEENKHLLALDVAVQAATGMAHVNGSEPGKPLKVGFVLIDEASAMEASDLIVSHLFALARGKKIPSENKNVINLQISMANVSAYLMAGQYLNCITQQKEPSREGNKDNWLAPFSLYNTKEGMISLAIINEHQFQRLCLDVLQNEDLYNCYSTNALRMKHIDKFQVELVEILMKNTADYWLEKANKFKVPAGKVNTVTESLKQPFARNFFTNTLDGTRIIATPFTSSLYPAKILHNAPTLNEHQKQAQLLIECYSTMHWDNKQKSFQGLYNFLTTTKISLNVDENISEIDYTGKC